MDIINSFVIQLPAFVAALVLFMAALGKTGRERGAGLFLLGSIGLLAVTILNPVIYTMIMPRVVNAMQMEASRIGHVYMLVGLVTNLLFAASVVLLALGTFMRAREKRGMEF